VRRDSNPCNPEVPDLQSGAIAALPLTIESGGRSPRTTCLAMPKRGLVMVWIVSSTMTLPVRLGVGAHHPSFLSAGCRSHRCEPLYFSSRRGLYESNALLSGLEADAFPLGETPLLYCILSEKQLRATWISPGRPLGFSSLLPRTKWGLDEASPKASPYRRSGSGSTTNPRRAGRRTRALDGLVRYAAWRRR
jgi:hypothetical protein